MSFETTIKIHFDEGDPAGIAFSGGILTTVHRAYEDFIDALGVNPKEFFLNPQEIYPLRHSEAEYFKPLLPLETYRVQIHVLRLSDSSFQLEFLVKDKDTLHCSVRTTHVCVDKNTMKKTSIPARLKQNLESFVIPQ